MDLFSRPAAAATPLPGVHYLKTSECKAGFKEELLLQFHALTPLCNVHEACWSRAASRWVVLLAPDRTAEIHTYRSVTALA